MILSIWKPGRQELQFDVKIRTVEARRMVLVAGDGLTSRPIIIRALDEGLDLRKVVGVWHDRPTPGRVEVFQVDPARIDELGGQDPESQYIDSVSLLRHEGYLRRLGREVIDVVEV